MIETRARKPTRRQREILAAIIEDTRAQGTPPTQGRVAAITGKASPWEILDCLARRGYLRQPYHGAPWVPVRGLDGEPLRLDLVPVEEAKP